MYGLLVQILTDYMISQLGEDKWREIKEKCQMKTDNFKVNKNFSETLIPKICSVSKELYGMDEDDIMVNFGMTFLHSVPQYGNAFDRILHLLGRDLSGFVAGLDSLHDNFKVTFPKIKPPRIFVKDEDEDGMLLNYSTRRKFGYGYYIKGQLVQAAKEIFNQSIQVEVLKQETFKGTTSADIKMKFDNMAYRLRFKRIMQAAIMGGLKPIEANKFFNLFPFHVLFNRSLTIISAGKILHNIFDGNVHGRSVDELFVITKPAINFDFDEILTYRNVAYELRSQEAMEHEEEHQETASDNASSYKGMMLDQSEKATEDDNSYYVQLKGGMFYMDDRDEILFLGRPLLDGLANMFRTGIYITDLAMHDLSRELVFNSAQQSADYKLATLQAKEKVERIKKNKEEMAKARERFDELKYCLCPDSITAKLKSGEPAMSLAEVLDDVSLLCCRLNFGEVSAGQPKVMIPIITDVYLLFVEILNSYTVYKVATSGEAFVVSAGAPEPQDDHALQVSNMALDMINTVQKYKNTMKYTAKFNCKMGCHTGSLLSCVLGIRVPRYCIFGETVHVLNALEMEARDREILCSAKFKDHMSPYPHTLIKRTLAIENSFLLYTLQNQPLFLLTSSHD